MEYNDPNYSQRVSWEEELAQAIETQVQSVNGPHGISAFLNRAAKHWGPLKTAWTERYETDGDNRLGRAFLTFTLQTDASDLRATDVPIRLNSYSDFHVQSKFLKGMIQVLANNDEAEVNAAVAMVAKSTPDLIPALLLQGNHQFDQGHYDDAIISARTALAKISYCPASTDLLYRCFTEMKKAGTLEYTPEVYLGDLSDRFCSSPFKTISTYKHDFGDGPVLPSTLACECGSWLPYQVSEHREDEDAESIWNGPAIQEIRRSILDGDFRYCSRMLCGKIIQETLPKRDEVTEPRMREIIENHVTELDEGPSVVTLSHDPSCNLACPSCRLEILTAKNKDREILERHTERVIMPLLKDTPVNLSLSGNGDPFASKLYRKVFKELDPKHHSGVRIDFLTNGLLLTADEWEALGDTRNQVSTIRVSIDAATKETYEDVRRPGKWSTLVENMTHLGKLRACGEVPYLSMNFAVQKKNFEEMPAFVELGLSWNMDLVTFWKLLNFGTYSQEEYDDNNVADPRNPLHERFLEIMAHPIMSHKKVETYNLTGFLPQG